MSSCCSSHCDVKLPGAENRYCPECGQKGKNVGRQAMEHLLLEPLVAQIGEGRYYFCRTRACRTVYFSAPSETVFVKADLKVRVGIKETEDPIPICYCFGHTRASAWEEIERTGKSTVLASIQREVKAGRCECEVKNPSGKCCLGDVTRVVQEGLRRCRASIRSGAEMERRTRTADSSGFNIFRAREKLWSSIAPLLEASSPPDKEISP